MSEKNYGESCLTKLDLDYMHLVDEIINEGIVCENRTGVDTIAISGSMIKHDMSIGFPLLTIKKVLFGVMATELEGFIKGISDKKWYQDRGCNIWDKWHNPKTNDENDLGKIYGYQWNNFGGVNQLAKLIDDVKNNPNSRRIIVSAWNPSDLGEMALPPCHVLYQVNRIGDKLDLVWYQRSVDVPLGLPFNIASYALLLELICNVTGNIPGKVIGMLSNCHIYEDQLDPIKNKLIPQAKKSSITTLPKLVIKRKLDSIYDFDASKDVEIVGYEHQPFVKIPVTA